MQPRNHESTLSSTNTSTPSPSTCSTSMTTATTTNAAKPKTNLKHSPTRTEALQKSLPVYLAIEAAWHISLFAACYRYRPLAQLGRTRAGKKLMERLQTLTSFSTHSKAPWWQDLHSRFQALPLPGNKQRLVVALSEWFFFNKAIGIPLWPTKILLAGYLYQTWEHFTINRPTDRATKDHEQKQ